MPRRARPKFLPGMRAEVRKGGGLYVPLPAGGFRLAVPTGAHVTIVQHVDARRLIVRADDGEELAASSQTLRLLPQEAAHA